VEASAHELIRKVYLSTLASKDLLPQYGWYPTEPQSPLWWGGLRSPFEIAISSILVQQTRWENVAKTIKKLNQSKITDFNDIKWIRADRLSTLLKGINFRKRKARTIVNLTKTILAHGNLNNFFA